MGKKPRQIYKELPSTELIAICDVNPERAKAIADQYGVKAYTNSSRMFKNKEIEAVSVCTWSTVLAKEALKGLKAGKHVLVEKPMATNTKQAKKLCATAEQNGLVLTVGFLMRFIPGVQVIREAVEKRKIGDLVCANAKRVSQWPERIGDVGVVKDTAIHDIDVMRFISQQDPITVYAKMGSMRTPKIRRLRTNNAHIQKRRKRIHRIQLANTLQNPNVNRDGKRRHNEVGLYHSRNMD